MHRTNAVAVLGRSIRILGEDNLEEHSCFSRARYLKLLLVAVFGNDVVIIDFKRRKSAV